VGFVVFICFFVLASISSSTSFFLMNSSGWKSLSILSINIISSLFTNLLNSDISLLETFFSSSTSFFICRLSFFISLSSSSVSWREDIKFFPKRRTRSLISRFRSSMSLSLVLKSVRRNWTWPLASCCSGMLIIRVGSL